MSNQLQGILASGGYLVVQLKPNEEKKLLISALFFFFSSITLHTLVPTVPPYKKKTPQIYLL